jgi:hypothetical protein
MNFQYSAQQSPTSPNSRKIIRGNSLAHRRMSRAQRTAAAVEFVTGEAQLVQPTCDQAAAVTKAAISSVRLALRNGNGNGHRPPKPKPAAGTLLDAWNSASEAERIALFRDVGADDVWTTLTASIG